MLYEGRHTRRKFMADTALGTVAVSSAASLLAACGGESGSTTAGAPQQGGTLNVAVISGGQGEAINPAAPLGNGDTARIQTTFDPLVTLSDDLQDVVPMLAETLEPNSDYSVWQVKLRPDVTFHDGKPFTADDVIYTMQAWSSPSHFGYTPLGQSIDYDGLRKVNDLTVEVPFKIPIARLGTFLAAPWTYITAKGAKDFTKPIGTGPFRLKSFDPGRESVGEAFEDYWQKDRPYLDELVITSFSDPTAELNALLGGEVDVYVAIPYQQARGQQGSDQVKLVVAEQPGCIPITMRIDQAPFDDVRVRQAMRLIADRQALVDNALQGFGTVGNDIPGPGIPFYADSLEQRTQDIEQAKSLLASAGKSNLSVTLQTSNVIPGFVESATLYSEQAKQAGVNVSVKQEPASAYFDPSQLYLRMLFGQDNLSPMPSLDVIYTVNLTSNGPYNETKWGDKKWDDLVATARGSSGGAAEEAWMELQKEFYENGSFIVWGQPSYVDATSSSVGGLQPSKLGNAGNYSFGDVWIST